MEEGSEKVEGTDGEKWSKWLVETPDELDGIKHDKLRVEIRLLARAPDPFVDTRVLSDSYKRIDEMVRNGEVAIEDAAPWQIKISDRHEKLNEIEQDVMAGVRARIPTVGQQQEKRQSLREVPLYFGAVFKGGKNEGYVDRPDLIPILEADNESDRTNFIFKNIHAFDYRFKKGSAWKGAVEDWIKDFTIANETTQIDKTKEDEFLKRLKAMMAVTASARAMEDSAGVMKSYLVNLVGANERGDPNLDEQDLSSTLLLHADPEKMETIIGDPLVGIYYAKLMEDAGLVYDKDHEWHEVDVDGKKTWMASTVELARDAKNLRERSLLLEYVGKEAEGGGFQKYIDDVLVKLKDPKVDGLEGNVKMTAARIACDFFLVDKWTRWEDELQEHDEKRADGKSINLKLQPRKEWGGNPLKSILKPTFLPRLKKVYSGEDERILDLVDSALKPDDIFAQVLRDKGTYKNVLNVHPVIPSMVTNLKTLSRLSDATYKVFGGSMADGLPNWSPKMMQEELPSMANLLTQVYGSPLTVEERASGREVPMGKHLVGAMMMRLLYVKAIATAVESSKPGFTGLVKFGLDPESKDRPFMEVMYFLYGPNLDAKSGFIQSLAGGRTRLVIRDNMFNAEKTYTAIYEVLRTNDQTGGKSSKAAKYLRLGAAIGGFLGEVAGGGGKRR